MARNKGPGYMTNLVSEIKRLGVIEKGNFDFVGGGKGDYYVNLKKSYGHPDVLEMISLELSKRIPKETTVLVSAVVYGGTPLSTLVSQKTGKKLTLVREAPKEHGTKKSLEGYISNENDKVVIIDDVFTTGTSIKKTIDKISSTKAEVIKTLVVVKRGESKYSDINPDHLMDVKDLISQNGEN